jgi:hypothetical protein
VPLFTSVSNVNSYTRRAGGQAGGGGAAQLTDPQLTYFAADGASSPWYMISNPNAFHVSALNKTYVSYEANLLGRRIARCTIYDHATGTWSTSNQVFRGLIDDAHGVPVLVRDHEDYMHAFGGAHGAEVMVHSVETSPGSNIWETGASLAIGSYPDAHSYGSQLHVFMRGNGATGIYQKSTSLSGGIAVWGSSATFIDLTPDSRFYHGNTILIGNVVHMVAARSNAADTERLHIYYFKIDLANGDIDNFAETTTTSTGSYPIDLTSANANYRILEFTGSDKGNVPVLVMDSDGYPVIAYAIGTSDTDLDMMIVRWNGSAWTTPVKIGDLTQRYDSYTLVKTSTGIDCYFAAENGVSYQRGGSIWKSTCADGSTSWSTAAVVAAPERSYPLDTPAAVKNGAAALRVVWSERENVFDEGVEVGDLRCYAYGDSGLIVRDAPLAWTPYDLGDKLRNWFRAEDYVQGRDWSDFAAAHSLDPTGTPTKSDTSFNGAYPGVSFNGSNQYFTGSGALAELPVSSTQGEVWGVASATDTAPTGNYLLAGYGGASDTRRAIILDATGNSYKVTAGSTTKDTALSTTNPTIIRGRFETSAIKAWTNGTDHGSQALGSLATGTTFFQVGGYPTDSRYWKGVISDVVVTELLTTDEAQRMEGYFAHARGKTSYLDGGHPYKTTAPTATTPPFAFTVDLWSVADKATEQTLTVTVTTLPNTGGSSLTAIQYRVNGGTWTASGITTTGTFDITGLTDDVSVTVELRAVNAIGPSRTSDVKSATPTVGWADTLYAAMSVQPDATRQGHIETLINALRTAGVWAKLDVFYVMAAHDAQAARLNWRNPATFALSAVNSPTFTTDRGYAGNGSSSYLNTAWDAATNGVLYTQNSASMFAWCRTSRANGAFGLIGTENTTGSQSYMSIANKWSDGNYYISINNTSAGSIPAAASADSAGLFHVNRSTSSAIQFYKNGSFVSQNTSSTSQTLRTEDVPILARRRDGVLDRYSTDQVIFAGLGASLSSTEATDLYNALNAYKTAVGA